jgi:hypothetical protein
MSYPLNADLIKFIISLLKRVLYPQATQDPKAIVYDKIMRVMDAGNQGVSLENGTDVMHRQTRTLQRSRERFSLSNTLPSSTGGQSSTLLWRRIAIGLAFNEARISATIVLPFGLRHFELCG